MEHGRISMIGRRPHHSVLVNVLRRSLLAPLALPVLFGLTGMATASQTEQRCVDSTLGHICHHIFEGMRVEWPRGEEILAHRPERLQVQLWVVSHRLAMPLGPPRELCNSDCDQLRQISLLMPQVSRETAIRATLTSHLANDRTREDESPIMQVYPDTVLDPLKQWAVRHTLVLRDRVGTLRAFLKTQDIRFTEGPLHRRHGPDRPVVFVVPKPGGRHLPQPMTVPHHAVTFTERVTHYPNITAVQSVTGNQIRVEMKVTDHLASDPLAQKLLLEIFTLSITTQNKEPL